MNGAASCVISGASHRVVAVGGDGAQLLASTSPTPFYEQVTYWVFSANRHIADTLENNVEERKVKFHILVSLLPGSPLPVSLLILL